MRITISVNDSIIMFSGQQSHLSAAHFFRAALRMLVKGTAFILSDNYDLPLPVGWFIVLP
jgi:hypothetical protein